MSERKPTTTDGDILRGERTWGAVCVCGHRRDQHWAETGAQGSFGGSACQACWTCGTFRDGREPALTLPAKPSPCPTGKRRYGTLQEAEGVMAKGILSGSERRRELRAYRCETCKGYHLTSHPRRD
jgi:hypothetical protein